MIIPLLLMVLTAGPTDWGLENFERQPVGPGWAGWAAPFGPAAARASVEVVETGRGKAGQVRWENAEGHLILPGPELNFDLEPLAVMVRVRCEGPPPALGVTLIDATGEWLQTPSQPLKGGGWSTVRIPLGPFIDHASGDQDGALDLPLQAFNLNLFFADPAAGTLWLDDIGLQGRPAPASAFLDLRLDHAVTAGAYVAGEAPPILLLENRGRSTVDVALACRLGDRVHDFALNPSPGQVQSAAVPLTATGPQVLDVSAETADGRLQRRFTVTLLPRSLAGADRFYGLGGYDQTDLTSGRFAQELPLLRIAKADWSLFWLSGRPGDPAPPTPEPQRFADAMTLAWAQQLRTIAAVAPPATGRFAGDLPGYLTALDSLLGDDPAAWLVPAGAAVPALRPAIAPGKQLLGLLGPGQPGAEGFDGLLAALPALDPAASAPPSGPAAWSRLQGLVGRLGPGPLALWSRSWPLEALTGLDDRGAATAVLAACLRAIPNLTGVCFGQVIDGPGVSGLTAPGQLRPELVAWAVAARLCGGLPCRGLVSPGPDSYAVLFGTDTLRSAVAWTEGTSLALPLHPGTTLYDHLGHTLPWKPEVRLHREPLYLVGPGPLSPAFP